LKNENFLDSRTLLAILLVGATFVGWQMYMQRKYPDTFAKKAESAAGTLGAHTAPGELKTDGKNPSAGAATATQSPPEMPVQSGAQAEKLVHYQSDSLSFDISSKGMGVRTFQILQYKNRKGETVELGHPEENLLPLETRLLDSKEALDFQIAQSAPNVFVGKAQVGGVTITKTMEINPGKYTIEYKVAAVGTDEKFRGLTTALTEEIEPVPSGRLLHPQFEKQEFYIDTGDSKDRVMIAKDDVEKSWSKVKLASVGSQYFTQAVLDKSSVMPDAHGRVNHAGKAADVVLRYPMLAGTQGFELAYTAFVGPKSLNLLRQVDDSFARVVDFGFFNWIGRHILDLLRAFYGLVGNWGLAIICLTVVVRLMVLPVNIYSYKSMRAMQAIQPQLQALRERYKDDQQKATQATMALMKENKVNPVGGCLPVLLQFPIFIALYQVLGNSIELYQAPFGLWIHDLSLKDPFYILPVLMGLTMFVQQKITPNTMDPAQAKVLLMMPLIFTFFMVSLPSGLTLYMLIGAVFSVAQQSYFMKQSKTLSGGIK
jgi:YidC/Oxa1 family membrane protein insertase